MAIVFAMLMILTLYICAMYIYTIYGSSSLYSGDYHYLLSHWRTFLPTFSYFVSKLYIHWQKIALDILNFYLKLANLKVNDIFFWKGFFLVKKKLCLQRISNRSPTDSIWCDIFGLQSAQRKLRSSSDGQFHFLLFCSPELRLRNSIKRLCCRNLSRGSMHSI